MSKEGRNPDGTWKTGNSPNGKRISPHMVAGHRHIVAEKVPNLLAVVLKDALENENVESCFKLLNYYFPPPKDKPVMNALPRQNIKDLAGIKAAAIEAINMMTGGEIEADAVKVYLDQLQVIGQLIVGTELEKRVEEVEKKLK